MNDRSDAQIQVERAGLGKWAFVVNIRHFIVKQPLGAASALVLILLVLVALGANLLAPYDPLVSPDAQLLPPSGRHILGTDQLGRDVLSRIIYGSRVSLMVGGIAVGIAVFGGTLIGLASGYMGGKVDLVLQRLVDSMMAFPGLLLALAMVSVLGPSITNAMIAVGIVLTPRMSRVVRGSVLSVTANQYIEAARAIGCSGWRIALRHILPNIVAPIIIVASVDLGGAIITEASLSFLGVGIPPPAPSWGSMLSGPGRIYLERAPWLAIWPGAAIGIVVLAFNLLGDALRDVLDPRLRGSS